ncbi:hypothetical protein CPB85DRAFT_1225669, partial [Mucidula mucida]
AERVLEELKEATWVHLACHGTQDATTPTNSFLTGLEFCCRTSPPFIFLMRNSLFSQPVRPRPVTTRSLHLAAGMLLAGYRSVIATMWSIADRHAADDVYAYLLRNGTSRRPDYKESALALHLAMEKLRERIGEGSFLAWVPYIHIGV